jgi:hypothetical protein
MTTLRELFALHAPRAAPAATLWDQWMTESSLWCKGGDTRRKWFDALSNRRVDDEGYVSTHQHNGLGHGEGWPFPIWPQAQGVGWHFTLKDMPYASVLKKTSPEGFLCRGMRESNVDDDGWRIQFTDPNAILISPPFSLRAETATYLKICWQTRNMRGANCWVEWTTDKEPEFAADRRVYFSAAPDDRFGNTMIPVFRSPNWKGEITRLRIGFANPRGAEATIRYICSSWDTRHNVNNACFIQGCCNYFHWTGDVAFLRANIQRMRLAMQFITNELGVEKYHYVHTTWPGHEGRSGLRHIGQGIGNNYWDLLPFGGDDCLATIYAYDAMNKLAMVEEEVAAHPEWNLPRELWGHDAKWLRATAKTVKEQAGRKFFNDIVGRFVACIDLDGVPHDYGYTFVNLEAISYGFATPQQAHLIMDWITGQRIVRGDTSSGEDIYHFTFAPRASTKRNTDWYIFSWTDPASIPFGGQVQDGGAVLGFSYHDLDARIKTLGPDDAWDRLKAILTWFDEVQQAGGYRPYYQDGSRGALQGNNTAGGLGMDAEFIESALVPQIMLYGFAGFGPRADGFALDPHLPKDFPELTITKIRWHEHLIDLKITSENIVITSDSPAQTQVKIRLAGRDEPTSTTLGNSNTIEIRRKQ